MNSSREIKMWERLGGRSPVKDYLDSIKQRNNKKLPNPNLETDNYSEIHSLIQKLAEHGEGAIDGRKIKKLRRIHKNKNLLFTEIKVKSHRIYSVMDDHQLTLLHGEDKTTNHTPLNIKKILSQRCPLNP